MREGPLEEESIRQSAEKTHPNVDPVLAGPSDDVASVDSNFMPQPATAHNGGHFLPPTYATLEEEPHLRQPPWVDAGIIARGPPSPAPSMRHPVREPVDSRRTFNNPLTLYPSGTMSVEDRYAPWTPGDRSTQSPFSSPRHMASSQSTAADFIPSNIFPAQPSHQRPISRQSTLHQPSIYNTPSSSLAGSSTFKSSRDPQPTFNNLKLGGNSIAAYNGHPHLPPYGIPRSSRPDVDRVDHLRVSSPQFEQSVTSGSLVDFIFRNNQTRLGSQSIYRTHIQPYFVSSFPGTSQYAVGGPSACGLASLCAVKEVLLLSQSCRTEPSPITHFAETIDDMDFHQSIIAPCASLTVATHFAVEDFLELPLFHSSLQLVDTMYERCGKATFAKLVEEMQIKSISNAGSIAAVITRPPEIVVLFYLNLGDESGPSYPRSRPPSSTPHVRNIFAVFDSHGRSNGKAAHPDGLAFVFMRDPEQLVEYLFKDLFPVDLSLQWEGDRGHNWQTQLLTQFTAHFLKVRDDTGDSNPVIRDDEDRVGQSAMQANVGLLVERAKASQLKNELEEARTSNRRLEDELNWARGQLETKHQMIQDLRATTERQEEERRREASKERMPPASVADVDWGYWNYPLRFGADTDEARIRSGTDRFEVVKPSSQTSRHPISPDTEGIQNPGILNRVLGGARQIWNSNLFLSAGPSDEDQQTVPANATRFADTQLMSLRSRMSEDNMASSQRRQNTPAWRRSNADKEKGKGREVDTLPDIGNHEAETKDYDLAIALTFSDDNVDSNDTAYPDASSSGGYLAGMGSRMSDGRRMTREMPSSSALPPAVRDPSAYDGTLNGQQRRLLGDDDLGTAPSIVHRPGTLVLARSQGSDPPYEDDYEVALREQRLLDDESRALGRERMELSRTFSESPNPPQRDTRTTVNRIDTPHSSDLFHDLPPSRRALVDPAGSEGATLLASQQSENSLSRLRQRMVDDEARLQADRDLALRTAHEADQMGREHESLLAEYAPQQAFECIICMDTLPIDFAMSITACEHVFCRECMKSHVVARLDEGRYPILCPVCSTDKNRDQQGVISNSMAELLGLSEAQYIMWEKLDLAQYSVSIDCPHCQLSSLVDRDDFQDRTELRCPLPTCGGMWCKKCMNLIDPTLGDHSCDGQAEMDQYIATGSTTKRCPGCTTPTEKTEGCNHMACTVPGCNTHFCWRCGETIIRTVKENEVRGALESHYGRCSMFDYN